MIDNRKLLFTVTALALIGVTALFVYSTTIQPQAVSLDEIDNSLVGKVITTNGTITHARTLSDGSLSLEIASLNSNSVLEVYFPTSEFEGWSGGNLTPGTVIEVTGEVLLYQESLEISVSSAQDLRVIAEATESRYDLWVIMDSVEMFDGMKVRTNGTMVDMVTIYSSEQLVGTSFSLQQRLENQTYSLECMCFNQTLEQFEEFDAVSVTGDISFYSNKGCWQLIVELVEPE